MASDNEPPVDPSLLGEWVRQRLRKAVPVALRSIIELSEAADSEQTKLQASMNLLGLVGVSQKQQIEVDHGIKASQAEVDFELEQTLKRLEASRQKALPPGSPEEDSEIEVSEVELIPVEKPSEESE